MHRLTILSAAATLTLTAACGDNTYVPVEVDDDSTADFERATMDVNQRAMSDDYVAPSSIFSYARARVSDRMQWADGVGAIGYPGQATRTDYAIASNQTAITGYEIADERAAAMTGYEVARPGYARDGYDANSAPAAARDASLASERTVAGATNDRLADIADYEVAWSDIYYSSDEQASLETCSDNGLATAPSFRDRIDAPTEQAGADARAIDDDGPSALDASTGEAVAEDLSCGAPIDNNDFDDNFGDVCSCNDLDCVADYVNDAMGCNACMTFVCGDELLGACAACAP